MHRAATNTTAQHKTQQHRKPISGGKERCGRGSRRQGVMSNKRQVGVWKQKGKGLNIKTCNLIPCEVSGDKSMLLKDESAQEDHSPYMSHAPS